MNITDNEKVLEHHGILGQKWGVRNGPPYPLGSGKSEGSITKNQIKKVSSDIKKKRKRIKEENAIKEKRRRDVKNRRRLSDKDLDRKIARLKKEKELKDLTDKDINVGKKAVEDVLSNSGKKIATAATVSIGIFSLNALLKKKGIDLKIPTPKKAGSQIDLNPNIERFKKNNKKQYDKLVYYFGPKGAKNIVKNYYKNSSTIQKESTKEFIKQFSIGVGTLALGAAVTYHIIKNPEKIAETSKKIGKEIYYRARPLKYKPNIVDTEYKEVLNIIGLLAKKR